MRHFEAGFEFKIIVTYVSNLCMVKKFFTVNWFLGMCRKENYSDSPSNEYSRHYSAEYLFRDVKI